MTPGLSNAGAIKQTTVGSYGSTLTVRAGTLTNTGSIAAVT